MNYREALERSQNSSTFSPINCNCYDSDHDCDCGSGHCTHRPCCCEGCTGCFDFIGCFGCGCPDANCPPCCAPGCDDELPPNPNAAPAISDFMNGMTAL